MKYNEIIHINEKFIPVFDLENEENDQYWSLFIPNDKFRTILSAVIDSMDINNQKNPVWLQGTYGTGKSHATSVIKHLLSDKTLPEDFDLENKQLTAKLNSFREKNNVFPVVLKGTSNINDSRTFKYTVQTAVKNALNNANMRVTIPSEFDNMVKLLNEGSISLNESDLEGTNLEAFEFEEIIMRLENQESEILLEIENILLDKNLGVSTQESIDKWLVKIREELHNQYGIDYLMIFWDEFTNVLNLLNAEEVLLEVQNIAEAKNKGVSLFIVSHRTRSTQIDFNEEKFNKIMDRFVRINYSMEPVATYELMQRSIKKDIGWEDVKNRFIDVITPIIERISKYEGTNVKSALEKLYPIHPYTAYLATFVAQTIGSTERSIFKFLHDDIDYGFRSFINTFEIDQRYFLTADYLWDFFYNEFEDHDDEKIASAVKRFKLHKENLTKKGEDYLVVFKVILLLNILYKMAQLGKESLAIPSIENINNVFIGSIYEDKVDVVLDYIDEKGIINPTPDGLFELTTNTLPAEQVNKVIEELRKGLTLNKLLDVSKISNIKTTITKKAVREIEINVINGDIKENKLKNDLDKGMFKNPGYLHVILFLCKTENEAISLREKIRSVLKQGLLEDIVVVISDALLGEKNLEKYLEYKARSIVAKRHNYDEDAALSEKQSDKYLDTWINDIKRKPISWYLNKEDGRSANLNTFVDMLKKDLSKKIYSKGLENIDRTLKSKNLWTNSIAKAQAERFMTSKTLDELQDLVTGMHKPSLDILKDNNGNYIVNNSLMLMDNAPENHPLIELQRFVDKTLIEAQKKGKFNLGKELMLLYNSPYGLYPNNLNIPALSFVLRKYVNKLYDSKGNSIDAISMKNKVINIFEFWSKNKKEQELYVRFGTENEKLLTDLLNKIFNLDLDSDNQSIDTVRWKLRTWIKKNKIPLWLLKYSDSNNPNNFLNDSIEALTEFMNPIKGVSDEVIQKCYDELKNVKTDLKIVIKKDSEFLFNNFINSLEQEVSNEEIPEIIKHVTKIMPEEIHDWDEDKVRIEILNWLLNHIKVQDSNPVGDGSPDDVSDGEGSPVGDGSPDDVSDGEGSPVGDGSLDDVSDGEGSPVGDGSLDDVSDGEGSPVGDVPPSNDSGDSEPIIDDKEEFEFLNKIENTDPNQLKNALIKALKENRDIQKIIARYL
ncbi:MAG: hypothetical protein U0L42_06565 [Methanobrevibacter sp.]|uniref:hypothetical protein n=1 Tax=Methanobrevibacter sp. TaxID=66852 RepID=UPI002E78BC88|nr:hypothetical protein [Methanobrevibacter sp.]MEE0935320.1 hypothetical protein [Methanobrevibacter sp.]